MVEVADGANVVTGNDGDDQADVGTFVANVLVILVSEVILAQAGEAAVHGGSAAAEDEQDVFADLIELFAVAGAEAFA